MVGRMMLVETFIFSTWDPNFFFSITWNGFWYVEDKKGITALHEPFFVLHAYFSDAVLNALPPKNVHDPQGNANGAIQSSRLGRVGLLVNEKQQIYAYC